MKDKINEDKSLTPLNSITENISLNKSLNSEMKQIVQEFSFFKNDLLMDVRKLEEKFNYKLLEQSVIVSEQYDSFERRLSELSDKVSQINQITIDNDNVANKIKTLLRFKTEADINIGRLFAQLFDLKKQNKEFTNNIEAIINDNLEYPGIIGKKCEFLNFRNFIDYTLKNFKGLNEFIGNFKTFNVNEFKRKINSEISEFRFSLSEDYKKSIFILSNNLKEFDAKVEELIKANNKKVEDNEIKFEELKNNINNCFSEYQSKFEIIEKNINEKRNQQLKEIDNIINLKQELKDDISNFKSSLENIKTSINDINDKINNIERHNSINENGNNDYYQNSENKNNKENSQRENSTLIRSKSFERFPENNNSKISDKNKDLSLTQEEIKNQEEKKDMDSYYNTIFKEIKKNNYSIANIANIKIKKVILPEYIIKRNKRTVKSSSSENKGTILFSKNQSSTLLQKSCANNKNNSSRMRKGILNLSKINNNNQKIRKNKTINLSQSSKLNNPKVEINNSNEIKSLITIKSKSNSMFKRGRKNSFSYEKEKNTKDEEVQIGFRRTFNLKNKIKDIILINSRNLKKRRKIMM